MIGVIDIGGGNLRSLTSSLDRLNLKWKIVQTGEESSDCDRLILPGVGHARPRMASLIEQDIKAYLRTDKPLLGICLGMQLLFEKSEEGNTELLGLLPGKVQRFADEVMHPHMGWNRCFFRRSNPLFEGINSGSSFYYVHSYYAPLTDTTCGESLNGNWFSAAVSSNSIYGVQFHPEKSGPVGEQVLRNFAKL